MADAKDLLKKYHSRQIKVAIGNKGSWPPARDPKDVSKNSGVKRIWGPAIATMPPANWAKHVEMHERRVKEIEAGDWWR